MAFHDDGKGSGVIMEKFCEFPERQYTKLFVGGLAWETKRESLHRYFEQFGEIEEAVVIYDRRTGRSKGYGFVTYKDPESARRGCANPKPVIDGREANCNIGRPRQPISRNVIFTAPSWRPQVIRSSLYQYPLTYGYHPGYYYPSFRPMIYGPGYLYPQVYVTPSSKKFPVDPTAVASGGGYLLPSPNSMHLPGPSFSEPMHYSSGALVPALRPQPPRPLVPTASHEVVKKDSASSYAA